MPVYVHCKRLLLEWAVVYESGMYAGQIPMFRYDIFALERSRPFLRKRCALKVSFSHCNRSRSVFFLLKLFSE